MKIVLADDDNIIREGLKMIISSQPDFEIVGVGCNGAEAVELCRQNKADIAMLDIRMPVMDGISAAEIMLKEELCKPLLLTTFDEQELICRALKAGVSGYILKNSPTEGIFSALRTVYSGGTVFQQDILSYIRDAAIKCYGKSAVFSLLTDRELEVVKLIAEGYSNAEISETLFLSNGTVRNYISVILEKTGLEHRTQIAVRYLKGD
ncbi:MAG: response regulator [Ruminiclostridium sp.]